ncbi:MAG: tetratricopeptide repeat protein [Treponema sp.]|nr:tetratricopeptide repeat protein [Treponema sp.]MBQ4236890.1 tetratricopeptide repeat protein [Treponema sp.]
MIMNVKKIAALVAVSCAVAFSAFAQGKPDASKEWRNGNYARAIEICEAELEANPSNLDSYVVLCWALVDNKQYAEAEKKATAARKISSNDVRLIEVLGEAKYYLDKNADALSLFQMYIARTVENNAYRLGKVYYLTGEIYIRQAKYEHADIALSMAVRLEPSMSVWWSRLGYAREMARDYKASVAAYDRALELNPELADASRGKARSQSHL